MCPPNSLYPTKVDKDLEQCMGITTETEENSFLDEKGGEIQCAPKRYEGGQNAMSMWHKDSPKYKSISMDIKAKWQLKIFAL